MSSPLVSVILPFFNAAPTIERAIRSVLEQSYTNLELILIDNGSTDSSTEIAQRYVEKDDRTNLLFEDQQGVVHAANQGIIQANGKYVARMDADDYSYSNRIEQQVKLLEEHPEVGVVSGIVSYDGALSNEGFIRYVNWMNGIQSPEEISLNQFVEYPMANPSKMVRKELYDSFGAYEYGDFPEDYEFFLRLQSHGVKMAKVSQQVLKWSDLPTRLTRTSPSYSQEAFFKIKAQYVAKWLAKNNPTHPEVLVWGAGRVSRRRSDFLKPWGIEIKHYIDLKSTGKGVSYMDIHSPDQGFILSYIANWEARDQIRDYLQSKNFTEGKHFILCA